jgi:type II secretory pathway pseudopilin PulG
MSSYSRIVRRSSLAGFTLIELLVAAGITALLAASIAVVVRNVGATWSRASSRLGADAQARLVLDQIALDLQSALYRDDGNVWMAIDVLNNTTNAPGLWDNTNANAGRIKPAGGLSLQMNTPSLADARFGQAGVWLRFFTTRRAANTNVNAVSAPVAVGYQIIRRPTSINGPAATVPRGYLLHRAEVRPATENNRPGTLEAGFNLDPAPATPTLYSQRSAGANPNNDGSVYGDPFGLKAPGANNPPRNLDAVLADNVIDFGVRCYVRDPAAPGGLRLVFPAADATGRLGNAATVRLRGQLPPGTPASADNFNLIFPDVVDVMVRVLTDEGVAALANVERNQTPLPPAPLKYNSNVQQWWWGVAQENSRVYTRRIDLRVQPL